jgi:hypothetical protein
LDPPHELKNAIKKVSLYFLLLEHLAAYFWWATVCIVPCIMLLQQGGGLPLSTESPLGIMRLTVANLGLHTDYHSQGFCSAGNMGLCAGNQTAGVFTGDNWSIDGAWALLSWTDVTYR